MRPAAMCMSPAEVGSRQEAAHSAESIIVMHQQCAPLTRICCEQACLPHLYPRCASSTARSSACFARNSWCFCWGWWHVSASVYGTTICFILCSCVTAGRWNHKTSLFKLNSHRLSFSLPLSVFLSLCLSVPLSLCLCVSLSRNFLSSSVFNISVNFIMMKCTSLRLLQLQLPRAVLSSKICVHKYDWKFELWARTRSDVLV